MSDLIEAFKRTRAAAQTQMSKPSGRVFYSSKDEVELCGTKNLGMIFGVFLADKNNVAYRIINGFRRFRINKEVADKYGIKSYELRICDPEQYINISPEDKKIVETLNKLLEKVEADWKGCWESRNIAKYPPTWNRHLTVQFMKVSRRATASGNDYEKFEPGVKVLMSRSDAYYRTFESYIEDQTVATQDMEGVVTAMLSRDERVRSQQYMIKTSQPEKKYEFSITAISKVTEITDDDLASAADLNRVVVNVVDVDVEEFKKWIKLFSDTYAEIQNSVYGEGEEEKKAEEVSSPVEETAPTSEAVTEEPSPVVEEKKEETEEDNPFI